jgi:hypothetical protein
MQPLKRIAPVLVIHLLVQQVHRKDFFDKDSGAGVGRGIGHGGLGKKETGTRREREGEKEDIVG